MKNSIMLSRNQVSGKVLVSFANRLQIMLKLQAPYKNFCNGWCKREHVESNALNSWKLYIF